MFPAVYLKPFTSLTEMSPSATSAVVPSLNLIPEILTSDAFGSVPAITAPAEATVISIAF